VFVIATFTGLLLVAVVMHMSGVGRAALEQAVMQDAADATVLSAAAANARGMNIIALMNMTMAAVLAVLVALRLAQALATVLVVGVAVGCAIPQTAAAFCGLVEPANEVRSNLGDAADEYEDLAKDVLEQLHDAAQKVSDAVPYLAQAEALAIATSAPYSPPATGAVVWPFTDGLPTKEGRFETLCRKAAQNVTRPVAMAFGDTLAPVLDAVLGGVVEGLAGTFTDYFCGDSGAGTEPGRRPKERLRRPVGYPVGQAGTGQRAMCASESSRVDPVTGQCGTSAACARCASMGCDDCFGKWSAKSYSFGLWSVVRDEWVEWTDDTGVHRAGLEPAPVSGTFSLEQHPGNPCDSPDSSPHALHRNCDAYTSPHGVHGAWAASSVGPTDTPYDPICVLESRSELPLSERAVYGAPSGVKVEHVISKAFLVLSGCVIEEDITVEAQGEPVASSEEERSSMAPRELDVERYEKESTLRAMAMGKRGASARLSEVDLFHHGAAAGWDRRLSMAAAEYYSMDEDSESLWHMRWSSRLVRFSLTGATQGNDESSEQAREWLEARLFGTLSGDISGSIDEYILH
jgi:hypothetical protein